MSLAIVFPAKPLPHDPQLRSGMDGLLESSNPLSLKIQVEVVAGILNYSFPISSSGRLT